MNMTWTWACLDLPWKCHESAMKQQIHGRFMALSWRFHGAFMALSWHFGHVWICHKSAMMKPTCQIHIRFIADSCQFLSVPKNQNHVRFMSLSWQFHGTFTYKPYLGTVCQNLLEKIIQKVGVGCRFGFFLPNFSFIFGNMSDSCRFHGTFMALSSFRFLLFFQSVSWHLHGRFMALSWRFPGTFHFGHVWICHESAMNLPNLDETYISDSCLFVSIYLSVYLSSVFFWCYFHWWFFKFRLINFFCGFLWSKYRGIRNTQTHKLTFGWPFANQGKGLNTSAVFLCQAHGPGCLQSKFQWFEAPFWQVNKHMLAVQHVQGIQIGLRNNCGWLPSLKLTARP